MTEPGPIGMLFQDSWHEQTSQNLVVIIRILRKGAQTTFRSLRSGMALVQIDDRNVLGMTHADVIPM